MSSERRDTDIAEDNDMERNIKIVQGWVERERSKRPEERHEEFQMKQEELRTLQMELQIARDNGIEIPRTKPSEATRKKEERMIRLNSVEDTAQKLRELLEVKEKEIEFLKNQNRELLMEIKEVIETSTRKKTESQEEDTDKIYLINGSKYSSSTSGGKTARLRKI